MKRSNLKFILYMVAVGILFHHLLFAQTVIRNSVLGNGGATTSDVNHSVRGTVGQSLIGVTEDASHINQIGFWYQTEDVIVSVEQISETIPQECRLEQNYPNPFNPTTTIVFAIPEPSQVTLKLFDMLGREVATLVDGEKEAGEYRVVFDAGGLANGVYCYRIWAGGYSQFKKLVLLK